MNDSKSTITIRFALFLIGINCLSIFIFFEPTPYLNGMPRLLRLRSTKNKLVIFNAIGKRNNIALIEYSRLLHFREEEWDCLAFMFQYEEEVPDDDVHLRRLIDELGCTVPRTPGIEWGTFLLSVTPTFVSNYEYLALVLDDVIIPAAGPNPVSIANLLEQMEKNDISVISPGVMGDSHQVMNVATEHGFQSCTAEVNMLESYVQLFTREAWDCYYSMLHYSGKRGWCYNLCFKSHCPDMILAQNFSMVAWHMDNNMTEIPPEIMGPSAPQNQVLQTWTNEPSLRSFTTPENLETCAKLGCGEPAYTKEMLDQNRTITSVSISMKAIDCKNEPKFKEKFEFKEKPAIVIGESPLDLPTSAEQPAGEEIIAVEETSQEKSTEEKLPEEESVGEEPAEKNLAQEKSTEEKLPEEESVGEEPAEKNLTDTK